eukprot:TRINITY_DN20677_c0_g1_i2.p1 TRINITY_DN20677_c0_g1~~TRINITY_DN20677_c0_g1_i2.p1  ORF type:complete len:613 (+),score=185.08 TRINITY_DN20677_c0_g1_i2:155-1993(+)
MIQMCVVDVNKICDHPYLGVSALIVSALIVSACWTETGSPGGRRLAAGPSGRAHSPGEHRIVEQSQMRAWCATVSPYQSFARIGFLQIDGEEKKIVARGAAWALRKGELSAAQLGDAVVRAGCFAGKYHPEAAAALLRAVLDRLEATGHRQSAKELHQRVQDMALKRFEGRRAHQQGDQTIGFIASLYDRDVLSNGQLEAATDELMKMKDTDLLDAVKAGILLYRCAAAIFRKLGAEGLAAYMSRVTTLRDAVAHRSFPAPREVALDVLDDAITALRSVLSRSQAAGDAAVGAAASVLCIVVDTCQHASMSPWALQPAAPTDLSPRQAELYMQQVSAMAPLHLQGAADSCLSKKAVATAPGFKSSHREATKCTSGTDLRVIDEPNAPASAFILGQTERPSAGNMLIFDLRGCTFDTTFLARFGGEDFANRMLNHFVEEFKRMGSNQWLLTARERSGRALLSSASQTSIEIDYPFEFEPIDLGGAIRKTRPAERIVGKEASGREAATENESLQRRVLRAEQRAASAEIHARSIQKRWECRIVQLEQQLEAERKERKASEDQLRAQCDQIWACIRAGQGRSGVATRDAASGPPAAASFQEAYDALDVPTENPTR